jgi:integrase
MHDSVAARAAEFIEKYAKQKTRPASWKQTQSIFNRIVLPAWRGRSVHEIRRSHVIDLVEAVAEGNKDTPPRPVLANRTLAVTSKFFAWLCSRDVVVASPCTGVEAPGQEVARERKLSDDELVQLWKACDGVDPRHACAVRLLVLTAARRNEVFQLPWSEIDRDTRIWTLSAQRAKNKRAHTIPLSEQAWRIIASVPPGDPVFVLGRKAFDVAGIKHEIDKRLSFTATFTFHDLRRTAASGLQRVGTPPHIIEKILNHSGGTFGGVAGIYQRHSYDAEKAAALQRWADYVERLVSGQADDNVLPMRAHQG